MSTGGQAILGFKVYRQDCTQSDNEPVLLVTLPAAQFAHTDTTIVGGTSYKYHVTAYNQLGGESLASLPFEVTPITVPSGIAAPTRVTHTQTSVTM